MSCDQLVYETLSEVCKGTYLAWRPGYAPPLPWFAYSHLHGEEFFADDSNYATLPRYRIELLFKEYDADLIRRFEEAIGSLGTYTRYESDFVDSENCLMHDYRLALNPSKLRESEASDG